MDHKYLDIAMQYYVAARSATIARLMPVAGNLFHHAVEMLLKAFLRDRLSASQLKQNFNHDLKKLWREFKRIANDHGLTKFDNLVTELHAVEDLRYPGRGYSFSIDLQKGPRGSVSRLASKGSRHYQVNLEEMDEFVTTLLTGRVTPGYVRSLFLGVNAQIQYHQENLHPFIGKQ